MKHFKSKYPWPLVFHGLLSVCIGITILIWRDDVTNALIDCILVLKPSSYILEEWTKPTSKADIKVYYFNWTNPNDFKDKSIKPKFKELGPYFLSQEYEKVNVVFNENFTVTYQNKKTFLFDEKLSKGSLDDVVTSLNVIPTVAVDKVKTWNYLLQKLLSIRLNSVPYESSKKIGDLLFYGYQDPLLTTASYLPFLDNLPDMDKFAWFYNRNGSADYEKTFTIGTGQGNTTLGELYKWNYEDRGSYPGSCSNIRSHMEFFPRQSKDKLEIFSPDFCRKVVLNFNKTLTYGGIEAYKFTAGVHFIDSGTFNPDNKCLCSRQKCQKFGVVEYSSCKFGIPAYVSFPHFYMADPSFRGKIEGMQPNQENHESYAIMNPRTGIVLELKLAVQLNLLLEPSSVITRYSDVPEVMFPIFWFSVEMKMADPILAKLKWLNLIPVTLKAVSAFLVFLGMIILIHSLHRRLAEIQRKRYKKYHSRLREESKPLGPKQNYGRN